jgi:small subunit ribosomal protein S1
MSESFAELFEQSLKVSKIQPGGLLMGEVMRIENDFVVIDAGLKSEGIIPAEQFRDGAAS